MSYRESLFSLQNLRREARESRGARFAVWHSRERRRRSETALRSRESARGRVAAGARGAHARRGRGAAPRSRRSGPNETGPGKGQKAGHRRPARGRASDGAKTSDRVGETRAKCSEQDGGAHHCSSSPRRSETSFGTRRHSSQWSHCTHASEHSGWSSATSARLGPSSSSPMAAGERKSPFFLPLFSRSRSHARHAVEPGGQRDTRAIARLDARVWCARVRSRIEIDRRRCGEGAPPSGRCTHRQPTLFP